MRVAVALLAMLLLFVPAGGAASEAFVVEAKGAVLIDAASGRVLFGQNENAAYPMASTTKVMTTLLALEHSRLDEPVTAGKNAAGVPGTSMYLSEGETLSMEHMLYGLMLRSGNDAAVAVAEHISGSVEAFAELMNARAASLDADAHFVNPHGLDADGHQTSALGLARIFREAMKNPDFRTITATTRKVVPWVGNDYSRVLENKNRLLTTYEGAIGGKTGYTGKAGRCLVFCARREDMTLIGAVLNCPTWFDTAERMLDYGFEHFRMEHACDPDEAVGVVRVEDGLSETVAVRASQALDAAVPVGSRAKSMFDLPESVPAPVAQGDVLGTAQIVLDGVILAQCDLVAENDVARRDWREAFRQILKNWVAGRG